MKRQPSLTQVPDSIAWVFCATGNVTMRFCSLLHMLKFCQCFEVFLYFMMIWLKIWSFGVDLNFDNILRFWKYPQISNYSFEYCDLFKIWSMMYSLILVNKTNLLNVVILTNLIIPANLMILLNLMIMVFLAILMNFWWILWIGWIRWAC